MNKLITSLTIVAFFLLTVSCNKNCNTSGRCNLDPDPGPCQAHFRKFFFDKNAKKCTEFIYGGCQGVVPFHTLEECQKKCDCK